MRASAQNAMRASAQTHAFSFRLCTTTNRTSCCRRG
jgi:hypothetical protein